MRRLAASLLVVTACGGSAPEATGGGAPFRSVRSVALEEVADDPTVALTALTVSPGGDLYVVDGPAGRIRQFAPSGAAVATFGRPGDGPGELRQPMSLALVGDSIYVVERGSPRVTVFLGDSTVRTWRLPAQYGFWIDRVPDGFVAGLGTENERFAILAGDGTVRSRFGFRDPKVRDTPYWVFFVAERAVRVRDEIIVSSSFRARLRRYSLTGDSIGTFGEPPPTWIEPTAPPAVQDLDPESRRDRIADWSRSFTVVTQLAVVDDSLIVVGYGHHEPSSSDPGSVVHETADVYALSGAKLHEGVPFPWPIVAGGRVLYVIDAAPPAPWTISALEYVGVR